MPIYLYETKEPLPYEEADIPKEDREHLISCKINTSKPMRAYDSIFQDNHGFYGNADNFQHNKAQGYLYESDHILSTDEIHSLGTDSRIVLKEDEYALCKQMKDVSLHVRNLPTAAYPKAEEFIIEPSKDLPVRPFEAYAWLKEEELSNHITSKDAYPTGAFHKRQFEWQFKGKPVQPPDEYFTMQGTFPDIPSKGTKEAELIGKLYERWGTYMTYGKFACREDIVTAKVTPDPAYQAEKFADAMRFHAGSKKDLAERKCRFYHDVALVTCYDAPKTQEGCTRFAKTMLQRMAKDGIHPKHMEDIMLFEENTAIMNVGMDALEKDKAFNKELRSILKQAKAPCHSVR